MWLEARATPDYYVTGAQEPERGQHYPLVPPKGCYAPAIRLEDENFIFSFACEQQVIYLRNMASILAPEYLKSIVCLATSRKMSGRCIAGKEVSASGYGPGSVRSAIGRMPRS